MLNTGKLAGKTIYITGASRGIGKAMALKAAKDGAKIVVAAKTAEPHPKLPGTIYTAAKEIEAAGGEALPLVVDVRDEGAVQNSVEEAVKKFGGIDILINNASAISLTGTQDTSMKKFDLMHSINSRGTYLVTKCALPYLKDSKKNPHVLNISPPLNMNPIWFGNHVAYTMAKYGMSMCVLGMAEEFKSYNIAVNALWPKTAIITAAMEMLAGKGIGNQCRKTDIMADAAYVVLTRDARNFTGNFVIDENVLKEEGVKDFEQYAVSPGTKLIPDFFLDDVNYEDAAAAEEVSTTTTNTSSDDVISIFESLGAKINADLVTKTQAIYNFSVSGKDYHLDLKNGDGSFGSGTAPNNADVTFILNKNDFSSMFKGELKPQNAFMSGKLKIKGDVAKALTLDKLMGQVRSYHTFSVNNNRRQFSSEPPASYSDVPQVFDRIKAVASKDIVKKVDAVYVFDVEGQGKYFVDLKTGDGNVGNGEFPGTDKPDVTITMNQDNFLKMFNRELKPATAFMTGKLKLSGDLSKAMALEAVMKASRGEASFHTSATSRYAINFTSVPEVFDRISGVASAEIVSKVKSVYIFEVEGEGKYFIDFKNGEGSVGSGDPPSGKADVTIKMTSDNLLKMFNRELAPASAFMTGKIKVSGDLSKALTLESVMKAAAASSEEKK